MLDTLLSALSAPGEYFRGAIGGKPGERLSGSDLLRAWGVDAPTEGLGQIATDIGVGMATDPLSLIIPAGAALAGKALKGIKGLSAAKALPLRRGVTFVKDANTLNPRVVGGYKNAAGAVETGRINEVAKAVHGASKADGAGGTVAGWYHPSARTGAINKTSVVDPRETMRHELTHALINRAADAGSTAGLPLGWKAAANLKRSPDDFVHTLGTIADEMAGHAADGSGAWKFLQNAHPAYVEQFAKTSPLAAAIFEGRYIPRAAGGAAGLAGAGLAGYGMSRMGM